MGGRGGRWGRPGVPANNSRRPGPPRRPPAPSPHLDHELREGVDGQGAAQRGAQTQQPHEPQHSHLLQPPARTPGALARLPFSQQLLQATANPGTDMRGPAHARTTPRGGAQSRHTGRLGVGGGPGLTSQLPPVPWPVAPPTEAPSPGTWPAPHLPTEPCCLQTAVPSPTRSHGTLPEGPTAGSKL